ncbi:hypothetical protein [Candidatus Allofournierella merdipullorum]|uniref:hypothetical protein n=1 Tax=Candidatus Allofournierella merdipullorum TaxID=2838595 RepID=UPI002A87EA79|nr:hypothetical protein [Candidatus Fournierella merdipullorum]
MRTYTTAFGLLCDRGALSPLLADAALRPATGTGPPEETTSHAAHLLQKNLAHRRKSAARGRAFYPFSLKGAAAKCNQFRTPENIFRTFASGALFSPRFFGTITNQIAW